MRRGGVEVISGGGIRREGGNQSEVETDKWSERKIGKEVEILIGEGIDMVILTGEEEVGTMTGIEVEDGDYQISQLRRSYFFKACNFLIG